MIKIINGTLTNNVPIVDDYLTGIPQEVEKYGFCKTLLVRREVIHLKHIMTEVFVRKSIDLQKYLDIIDMSMLDYMTHLTNRLRRIHHLSRSYTAPFDEIVKGSKTRFFPTIQSMEGLNTVIALDFDGVVTSERFRPLCDMCLQNYKTVICSANPTITEDYFTKRDLKLPSKIYSCKGKKAKLTQLLQIHQKHDFTFFVDNEEEYLKIAWLFGIQTYHYVDGKIKYFTLKTR